MEKITVQLNEYCGSHRVKEPLDVGIPLPQGKVHHSCHLGLMDGQKRLNSQFTTLARWPDGSIRWVRGSALVDLAPDTEKTLELGKIPPPFPDTVTTAIEESSDKLVIHTAIGSIVLRYADLAWKSIACNGSAISSTVVLRDSSGSSCMAKADGDWNIAEQGPVFVRATLQGQWLRNTKEPLARFECKLKVFLETGLVDIELTTHNPNRARHPGGLWDLGDPGSVYFQELTIETKLPTDSGASIIPQAADKAQEIYELDNFNLYQDSSGGTNWRSRNHVDRNGEISTQFCGYKLTAADKILESGSRADPLISISHDLGQLDVAVPDFWQSFPSSVRKQGDRLAAGLFPGDAKILYELQGGEQKTLRYLMAHNCTVNVVALAYTPLTPVLPSICYERAEALPWFTANSEPSALDVLIAKGLDKDFGFFAKREIIDEFGWRNFGELFADHETLYQKAGESPLISHYNNQYDPIYGFARQFALTGDRRWFQLMDDLARHVTDIDIYHTAEDRTEYNNGLFWHTDHYLDAHTATHRTFSRHNDTSSTPGQTGGGPAEEHCYSTGLLYHYFLTGNKNSRKAVLDLANWIVALHEGQGGFLEQVLALKKREIRVAGRMFRGEHVTTHRYPFTRGTGNYLNTLLDAWILEPKGSWLERTETVIRNTIHPQDDIEQRDLLDIELRWSYLILLTSLFRYLCLKRQVSDEDEHYEFTKAAVLHYTQWMFEHERLFLTDKSKLEFANDTWVAQDIRKAMLMFQASELDPANRAQYQQKASEWFEETTRVLESSKEAHFTRVLAILMQNHGPHTLASPEQLSDKADFTNVHQWSPPVMTWKILALRIVKRALRALITLRPAREVRWLNLRLDRS